MFEFDQTPGLKIQMQENPAPIDFMNLFLTDDLITLMSTETNRYAMEVIQKNSPLTEHSRLHEWKDTNNAEIRSFIGLLFHMGIVQLPTIEHYWNTNILYDLPLCRSVMSRNRFQLPLRMWHFADNDLITDKLHKINPISSHFNQIMQTIYYPSKHLSLDESVILWRGRLCFRVYIKNKRHRYGVKLYELCESSGLILKFIIYQGRTNDPPDDMGVTADIVKQLMADYLDRGE